jgi:hypothetical protein
VNKADGELHGVVERYGLPLTNAEIADLGALQSAVRSLADLVASVDAARTADPAMTFLPSIDDDAGPNR